jgi:hypothetical protein
LTAGVFYSAGMLYWFSLVKNIFGSPENNNSNHNCSLALLSGLLFGLASWTRPEYVLYSALPLFLLICAFDQRKEPSEERNLVIDQFSKAALILPSVWFFVLLNFDGPLDNTFKQLIIGCAGLWIGVSLVKSGIILFTPRISVMASVFLIIICFVGLFFVLPAKKIWTANNRKSLTVNTVHGEIFAGRTKNNPTKQIMIKKTLAITEIRGVKSIMPDLTKLTPIHNPAQPIISCLKVLSNGPSKFNRTKNHTEGKMSAALENWSITKFLSSLGSFL